MIATRVGPYRIIQALGEGGMGAVYEAVQEPLGRRVAIKVLRAAYTDSPEVLARFFNEARAVQVIEHPGLVQISDFGQLPNGSPYLVMELLRGQTLSARQRQQGRIPLEQALHITQQLASILHATHAHGIVHRDIKPSNVMLVPDPAVPSGERVKLLDFGIAKMAAGLAAEAPLTRTGIAMGTPIYMSPEQCLGAAQVDGKSDVYALGVVLFELLAGRPPFQTEGDLQLLNMHLRTAPPLLQEFAPETPARIVALIEKMLHKDRAARPNMSEVDATCASAAPDATRLSARPLLLTRSAVSAVRPSSKRHWAGLLILPLIMGCLWLLARRPWGSGPGEPEQSPRSVATRSTGPGDLSVTGSVSRLVVSDLAVSADLATPVHPDAAAALPPRRTQSTPAPLRSRRAEPAAPVAAPAPAPAPIPKPTGGVYVD